jgi:hypothetical protein
VGCKLNQAEIDALAREIAAAGHRWWRAGGGRLAGHQYLP